MKVIKNLAAGGFGRVEEVELDDGTLVARKVFDPTPRLIADVGLGDLKARFKREVKTQRRLPGDLFLPVLDSDLDGDPPWFTMPLAEKTYEVQIEADRAAGRPTPEPLADILNCLEELHRLDYKHRDLKPSNILFHNGRWKLADFGLALPPTGETETLTATNQAFGSERYAAPEQANRFHQVLAKADIFAFGCILHDLVDGGPRTPYQKCTAPGPLGPIIEKCTRFEPTQRFADIATLRASLLHALSMDVVISDDPTTEQWEADLKTLENWEIGRADALLRYFKDQADRRLLRELDEERLGRLAELDRETWTEIAAIYCEWAGSEAFLFAYCDVIIGRLEKVFQLGPPATKSSAAIAAAKLGASHHRFYVMRRVLTLCGTSLDPIVAERLSIDILAEDAATEFNACATGIGRTIDAYHPLIRDVLR